MPAKPPVAPMIDAPSPEAKAFRSMPAEKAFSPDPVRMTTQQSSSVSSSSNALRHGLAHGAVDGVAGLGPVDGEDLDMTATLTFDC